MLRLSIHIRRFPDWQKKDSASCELIAQRFYFNWLPKTFANRVYVFKQTRIENDKCPKKLLWNISLSNCIRICCHLIPLGCSQIRQIKAIVFWTDENGFIFHLYFVEYFAWLQFPIQHMKNSRVLYSKSYICYIEKRSIKS